MRSETLSRPLRGIIPPMATPLESYDTLDVSGLEALVEHVLSGGPQGLFILGTTGEGPALSYSLRRELIARVCRQVGMRVPVLVGITDSSYAESLRMAEHAALSGASAAVVAPPFYFPPTQSDLLRLIEGLARDIELPFFLYNMPTLTKVQFDPETVARAAEMPKVLGLKDSSGSISYLRAALAAVKDKHPEFSVLVGPEHLLAEALLSGAHGGVPGGANIFPNLPTHLYQLFREGRQEEMQQTQQRMIEIGAPIWSSDESDSGALSRLKCALSLLGLCSDVPAFPERSTSPKERERIAAHLAKYGLLKSESAVARQAHPTA